jgi:hypothetical protein
MNLITIVFLWLIFLSKQQEIDALNCYFCHIGTDGCGPSFRKTGSGVIPVINSTSTYCTVNILLMFTEHFDLFYL